jgi:hypothetical protein
MALQVACSTGYPQGGGSGRPVDAAPPVAEGAWSNRTLIGGVDVGGVASHGLAPSTPPTRSITPFAAYSPAKGVGLPPSPLKTSALLAALSSKPPVSPTKPPNSVVNDTLKSGTPSRTYELRSGTHASPSRRTLSLASPSQPRSPATNLTFSPRTHARDWPGPDPMTQRNAAAAVMSARYAAAAAAATSTASAHLPHSGERLPPHDAAPTLVQTALPQPASVDGSHANPFGSPPLSMPLSAFPGLNVTSSHSPLAVDSNRQNTVPHTATAHMASYVTSQVPNHPNLGPPEAKTVPPPPSPAAFNPNASSHYAYPPYPALPPGSDSNPPYPTSVHHHPPAAYQPPVGGRHAATYAPPPPEQLASASASAPYAHAPQQIQMAPPASHAELQQMAPPASHAQLQQMAPPSSHAPAAYAATPQRSAPASAVTAYPGTPSTYGPGAAADGYGAPPYDYAAAAITAHTWPRPGHPIATADPAAHPGLQATHSWAQPVSADAVAAAAAAASAAVKPEFGVPPAAAGPPLCATGSCQPRRAAELGFWCPSTRDEHRRDLECRLVLNKLLESQPELDRAVTTMTGYFVSAASIIYAYMQDKWEHTFVCNECFHGLATAFHQRCELFHYSFLQPPPPVIDLTGYDTSPLSERTTFRIRIMVPFNNKDCESSGRPAIMNVVGGTEEIETNPEKGIFQFQMNIFAAPKASATSNRVTSDGRQEYPKHANERLPLLWTRPATLPSSASSASSSTHYSAAANPASAAAGASAGAGSGAGFGASPPDPRTPRAAAVEASKKVQRTLQVLSKTEDEHERDEAADEQPGPTAAARKRRRAAAVDADDPPLTAAPSARTAAPLAAAQVGPSGGVLAPTTAPRFFSATDVADAVPAPPMSRGADSVWAGAGEDVQALIAGRKRIKSEGGSRSARKVKTERGSAQSGSGNGAAEFAITAENLRPPPPGTLEKYPPYADCVWYHNLNDKAAESLRVESIVFRAARNDVEDRPRPTEVGGAIKDQTDLAAVQMANYPFMYVQRHNSLKSAARFSYVKVLEGLTLREHEHIPIGNPYRFERHNRYHAYDLMITFGAGSDIRQRMGSDLTPLNKRFRFNINFVFMRVEDGKNIPKRALLYPTDKNAQVRVYNFQWMDNADPPYLEPIVKPPSSASTSASASASTSSSSSSNTSR